MRDIDAELLELEAAGVVMDETTKDEVRTIVAAENAQATLPKSQVRRIAAQKGKPAKPRNAVE